MYSTACGLCKHFADNVERTHSQYISEIQNQSEDSELLISELSVSYINTVRRRRAASTPATSRRPGRSCGHPLCETRVRSSRRSPHPRLRAQVCLHFSSVNLVFASVGADSEASMILLIIIEFSETHIGEFFCFFA